MSTTAHLGNVLAAIKYCRGGHRLALPAAAAPAPKIIPVLSAKDVDAASRAIWQQAPAIDVALQPAFPGTAPSSARRC